jgi:predicted RNase H-like HicB family nuclease
MRTMKTLEYCLALPYATEVVPDTATDGTPTYLASHPDLDGCFAHGATPEEASRNLLEAKRLYLETMLADGMEPPLPTSRASATWQIHTPASGIRSSERVARAANLPWLEPV